MGAKLKAYFQGFWAKLTTDVGQLWQQDKVFVFIFGALILIVKFREIIMNILIWSAKNVFTAAQKEDSALQKKEDTANNQANQLVSDANKLPDAEKSVDDNWNEK